MLNQSHFCKTGFKELGSTERLHVSLRLAKSHPGSLLFYCVGWTTELWSNFRRRITRKKLLELTQLAFRPQTFDEFLFCFLSCHCVPLSIIGLMACYALCSILLSDATVIKHFFQNKKIFFRFSWPPPHEKETNRTSLSIPIHDQVPVPGAFQPLTESECRVFVPVGPEEQGHIFTQTVSFLHFFS